MKKIPTLFIRDFDQKGKPVTPEVNPVCQWVFDGEGIATVKFDGTCCMVRESKLYKRYDRKPTTAAFRARRRGIIATYAVSDFKPAPDGWIACENAPDVHTGHWPGWLPVGDGPEDKWYREAWVLMGTLSSCTYELVGPKINGNPEGFRPDRAHELWPHGVALRHVPLRDFDSLRAWLACNICEGLVFHHEDGRMAKIKRTDFGLEWPVSVRPSGETRDA